MKKNKEYLTTGEFAALFGVKKQTLFHYDDMGIFRPAVTDDNGYRYYSHNQLETFSIILMLRELGLSIKEIKEQIDRQSPEDLVQLLEKKDREIDLRIEHLRWAREYIKKKADLTLSGIALKGSDGRIRTGIIMTEKLPDEVMIMTRYMGPGDTRTVNEAIGEHFRYMKSLGLQSCYPDGATIPVDSVVRKEDGADYSYENFYTVLTPSEAERMRDPEASSRTVTDFGGDFLTIYDDHGYDNVDKCLLKLLDHAGKNGLTLSDHFYEDVIWDDLSRKDNRSYLIRISIQVIGS